MTAPQTLPHQKARADLAAIFRWTAREGLHESVANHFSLAVNDAGTRFLINPLRHFGRMRASDLWEIDTEDRASAQGDDAPDETAWGLHAAVHRHVPHARCALHLHSPYATVLASLADSTLPPVDQSSAMFFRRHVVDEAYGGLALEEEGTRCARLLHDPATRIMVMGNHGVLAIGESVAETFTRLYYFERAARTYVMALQTGRPLRVLSDEVAEEAARAQEDLSRPGAAFLSEIRAILDAEDPSYAT